VVDVQPPPTGHGKHPFYDDFFYDGLLDVAGDYNQVLEKRQWNEVENLRGGRPVGIYERNERYHQPLITRFLSVPIRGSNDLDEAAVPSARLIPRGWSTT